MISGKEIRWFTERENTHILEWFKTYNQEFDGKKTRTDFYLSQNLSESISIKLREGDLEIKKRNGKGKLTTLSKNCVGYVELWEKWDFNSRKNEDYKNITSNKDGQWIPIEKERLSVKFKNDAGKWKEVDSDKTISSGCQVEYTKVNCRGQVWYSFLLEWFGQEFLQLPDGYIEQLTGNSIFDPGNSYGYPAFLIRFDQLPKGVSDS